MNRVKRSILQEVLKRTPTQQDSTRMLVISASNHSNALKEHRLRSAIELLSKFTKNGSGFMIG